jgi:hypothetical protein
VIIEEKVLVPGRVPTLWGAPDQETYDETDPIEALVGLWSYHNPGEVVESETIVGMAPTVVSDATREMLAEGALDRLLERLSEDLTYCECDDPEATDTMREAAREFVRKVMEEYPVTLLDPVVEVTYDTSNWGDEAPDDIPYPAIGGAVTPPAQEEASDA